MITTDEQHRLSFLAPLQGAESFSKLIQGRRLDESGLAPAYFMPPLRGWVQFGLRPAKDVALSNP